jgi:hypothetical protein
MNGRPWTPEERSAALRLPYAEFSRIFPGRTEAGWRNLRHSARDEVSTPAEPAEPLDLDAIEAAAQAAAREAAATEIRRRIDERRDELIEREVAREVAAKITAQARHEEIVRLIESGMARMPAPEAIPHPPHEGSGTPELMVAVVSDPHAGKLVAADFVGEGFAYNRYLFHERVDRWEQALMSLQSKHENAYPVRRLVLPFLGDIVDGVDMRRGHGLRVDVNSAVKQALMASRAFGAAITRLSAHFDAVDADVVAGNHGRVGEYGVAVSTDNWDHVFGLMLQAELADLPNVSVRVPDTYHDIVQIGPLKAYLAHGNWGVPGGGGFGGIPFYGVLQAAAKDTGLHQHIFDLYAIGHFHQAVMIPYGPTTILVNGAWDGGDDFSVNSLKKASAPIQWAFGVHPERGMTWHYPIDVSGAKRLPTPVHELAA